MTGKKMATTDTTFWCPDCDEEGFFSELVLRAETGLHCPNCGCKEWIEESDLVKGSYETPPT
jgi:transcription elongation factor Elf1